MTEKAPRLANRDNLLFIGSLTAYLLVGLSLAIKPSGYPIFAPARPTPCTEVIRLHIAQALWWSAGPLEGLILLTVSGVILRKQLFGRGRFDAGSIFATIVLALLFLLCWGFFWWCDVINCI